MDCRDGRVEGGDAGCQSGVGGMFECPKSGGTQVAGVVKE